MRLSSRLHRGDDGFTLVELLVVMVILALIVAPLTAGVVVFLRNTDQTTDRLAESHDAQIAAIWFTQDVQNIGVRDWSNPGAGFPALQSIETNAPATGGLYPCGGSGTPEALVRFAWDDPSVSPPARLRASYVLVSAGSERQLRRLICDPAGTVTSDTAIAHYVDPSTNPVVACLDAAAQPAPCAAVPPPRAVSLVLALRAPSSTVPFTVTLTAQRRQA